MKVPFTMFGSQLGAWCEFRKGIKVGSNGCSICVDHESKNIEFENCYVVCNYKEKSNVPDKPETTPKPPQQPKKPKPIKEGNIIKMKMAKEIVCSLLISQRKLLAPDYPTQACDIAEHIFNRFNK
jgi:hypothetical protein